MFGALCGDFIGSVYEFDNIKTTHFELVSSGCSFTDDTVLTVAIAEAFLNKTDIAESIKKWVSLYPDAGYGGMFRKWISKNSNMPYNSFGNGSAMRVSAAGWVGTNIAHTMNLALQTAVVTHNHPEGIKGAQATAVAIFMARKGYSKSEISNYISEKFGYNLSQTTDEIRPSYSFNAICQETVPQAIICFLESKNWEEAIRLAISLGGDSDTLAAICGSIAEAFYGGVPQEILDAILPKIPKDILTVLNSFSQKYLSDSRSILWETCVESFSGAKIAQSAGSDRVEFCQNLLEGGTTPSAGAIINSTKNLYIPINVLIRPRAGDFLYSDEEFEEIKEDVAFAKKAGCAGIVTGFLSENGDVDKKRTKEIVKLAEPMSFTFHRAFDVCKNPSKALEDIIDCGCDRILTSGQQPTAEEGSNLISELIKQAKGRMIFLVGGGVRFYNLQKLHNLTKAKEFHSTARDFVKSKMLFKNTKIKMGADGDEYQWKATDYHQAEKIAKVKLEIKK